MRALVEEVLSVEDGPVVREDRLRGHSNWLIKPTGLAAQEKGLCAIEAHFRAANGRVYAKVRFCGLGYYADVITGTLFDMETGACKTSAMTWLDIDGLVRVDYPEVVAYFKRRKAA